MLRILMLVLMLSALASAGLGLSRHAMGQAPGAAWIDVGTSWVVADKVLSTTLPDLIHGLQHPVDLPLRNPRPHAIRIAQVLPGCTCVKPSLSTLEIGPGETGTLPLVFDTSHLTPGAQQRSLTLVSDDPTQPRVTLQWNFQLLPLFAVDSLPLRISGLPGASFERTFDLPIRLDSPVELLQVAAHHGQVTPSAEVQDSPDPTAGRRGGSQSLRLRLTAAATNTPAILPDDVEVTLREATGREFRAAIAILVEVRDVVSLDRNLITFRPDRIRGWLAGEFPELSDSVYVESGEPGFTFQIQRLEFAGAPPGVFSATWTPVEAGRRYQVTVTLNKALNTGRAHCQLRIVTDAPVQPERRITVSAHFPR
ncbi:MAG: DUF1573 domain-containing protein [Planctomycetota bacterium]